MFSATRVQLERSPRHSQASLEIREPRASLPLLHRGLQTVRAMAPPQGSNFVTSPARLNTRYHIGNERYSKKSDKSSELE